MNSNFNTSVASLKFLREGFFFPSLYLCQLLKSLDPRFNIGSPSEIFRLLHSIKKLNFKKLKLKKATYTSLRPWQSRPFVSTHLQRSRESSWTSPIFCLFFFFQELIFFPLCRRTIRSLNSSSPRSDEKLAINKNLNEMHEIRCMLIN